VFIRENFARLAGLLSGLKGKLILSFNDTPGARETFAGFRMEAVKTQYSISTKANQAIGEVLMSNFKGR
jgi:DNA adenine methylase